MARNCAHIISKSYTSLYQPVFTKSPLMHVIYFLNSGSLQYANSDSHVGFSEGGDTAVLPLGSQYVHTAWAPRCYSILKWTMHLCCCFLLNKCTCKPSESSVIFSPAALQTPPGFIPHCHFHQEPTLFPGLMSRPFSWRGTRFHSYTTRVLAWRWFMGTEARWWDFWGVEANTFWDLKLIFQGAAGGTMYMFLS